MNREHIQQWLAVNTLTPIHVDCATTVMLKILDGKCKMRDSEKRVMSMLYDAVNGFSGQVLDPAIHLLIAAAQTKSDDALKNVIYEKRLLAETAISRPVMKGFKAMIRETGLLDDKPDDSDNPE
jgi:hypothetical protein